MPPERLDAAIKLGVTTEPVTFTRIFLMWRGVTDEELPLFGAAGEKEAAMKDWKGVLNIEDEVPDTAKFRVLETSIMELVNRKFPLTPEMLMVCFLSDSQMRLMGSGRLKRAVLAIFFDPLLLISHAFRSSSLPLIYNIIITFLCNKSFLPESYSPP